jgi:ubiquinone/menaquinone biosynthesis C-methylase UbiE
VDEFTSVRIGKRFELTVEGEVTDDILAAAQRIADEILSNSVIEDVVGIDVSDARFDIGRAKNGSVKLLKTDGVSFAFPADHFVLVTQFVCFSNIPTRALRQHTAKEMARVLKGGGYVFWWDLPSSTAPTDSAVPIEPADYLTLSIAGPLASIEASEALRYFPEDDS